MKRTMMMVVLLFATLVVTAQSWTEYNRLGDEAMERLDYSIAKIYYEEGIPNCDPYSIDKLTSIWLADESMRTTMRNVMSRCLECLTNRANEFRDTASMKKLILYYTEGIGVYKNETRVAYWEEQLDLLRNVSTTNMTTNKPPREKVKMKFFAGYSASYYAPYGLTVGGVGRTVGWYLRFRTNMSFQNYAAIYEQKDEVERLIGSDDIYPEPTLDYRDNLWMGTGGIIIKAIPSFYISAGVGYLNWERLYEVNKISVIDAENQGTIWAKVDDKKESYSGWALDLDATFRMGKVLYGSLGCSVLNFEFASANAGIGVFF
jgi:hypothetical protein